MGDPPEDVTRPNPARMYDYWLGGTDNYEADRLAAAAVEQRRPNVAEQALENKKFQTRAVTWVARRGVAQFLDIGSGLPTSPARAAQERARWQSTHEAARAVIPDAVVAYVDHDQAAVARSRALLAAIGPRVVAVTGDMTSPEAILADPAISAAGLDLTAPACVVLGCVLHFLSADTALRVVRTLTAALAPGSYVIISIGWAAGRAGDDFARAYNAQAGPRIYAHSMEQITALFEGLELAPPGLVDCRVWRAEYHQYEADPASMILAGVARRP